MKDQMMKSKRMIEHAMNACQGDRQGDRNYVWLCGKVFERYRGCKYYCPTSRRNFPLVTLLLSLLLVMFMQNTEETFLRCKCTGNCNGGRGVRGGWKGCEWSVPWVYTATEESFESNIHKRGIKSITLSRILSLLIRVDFHFFGFISMKWICLNGGDDAIMIDDLDEITSRSMSSVYLYL